MSELPRQIGPFRIVRRLGQGGAGEVFLATAHGASGFEKRVALKVLREELRGDPSYERRLLDEARLAARFAHPNVVAVHDLGLSQGTYWVRMDWVNGPDLALALARKRPSESVALDIVLHVARALAYLHSLTDDAGRPLGLVHRDVSPTNILLAREGHVRLTDFGIAKATLNREDTEAGVRKGTYAYMSPEQVKAAPLTAASDQFSLGVVFYELLTGARPFDGEGLLDTMEHIREALAPTTDALTPDLAAIVLRLLARDPAGRFATDADLLDALETARRARPLRDAEALADYIASLDLASPL